MQKLAEILLSVFKNFIPNKTQKFDNKTPDWMNRSIALSIKKQSTLTKRYYANPTGYNKEMLLHQVSECTKQIIEAKDKHLAKLNSKLDNPDRAPKTYWSIINKFLNNKKIPITSPVLYEGDLISDLGKKAELCNNHFASQCSLVKNASTLTSLECKADERLNILIYMKMRFFQ